MSWLSEHKRGWRLVILGLLLIAIVGPWTFDLINVPSEYSCSAPFIRLKGDYCGTPLSGMWILLTPLGALVLFLPFFSTLLLILSGNRRRQQILHLVVWGLATVSSLWWLLLSPAEWPLSRLWGLWLYIGLAPSMLILEVVLAVRRRSSQAR